MHLRKENSLFRPQIQPLLLCCCLFLTGLSSVSFSQAPNEWIGTSDGDWSVMANWLGNNSPAPDPALPGPFRILLFSGSEDVIANNDIPATSGGGVNIKDITFAVSAGSFTLTGIGLDMLGSASDTTDTADIVNLSTNTQYIELGLIARPDFTTALVFDTANGDIVVNGIISETGGSAERKTVLRKEGSHTLVLNAVNTFNGIVEINDGTLQISNLANGNSNSSLGRASTGPENLVFNGGTLYYAGASNGSTNRGFTLGTEGGTIKTDSGIQVTFSGMVTGDGDLTIAKDSIVALTSTASNFTGHIYIEENAVFKTDKLDHDSGTTGPLGESTTDWRNESKIHLNGGTFQFTGGTAHGTVHGLNLHELGGTVSITSSGIRMEGKVTGIGDLHLTGNGYLALTNNNNDYSGVTYIHSGTRLEIRQANALGETDADSYTLIENGGILHINPNGAGGTGSASLSIAEYIFVNEGGTIRNSSNNNTFTNNVTLNGDANFDISATLTINSGKLVGSGDLLKFGSGTLVLGGANAGYTGQVTVAAGTLRMSNFAALGNNNAIDLILDGGTFNYTGSAAALERNIFLTTNGGTLNVTNQWRQGGKITGSGPLNITGNNYVAFSNDLNDYTGVTTIGASATVHVRANNALGATGAASATDVYGKVYLDPNGAGGHTSGVLTVSETFHFHDGSTIGNLSRNNTYNGPVDFVDGTVKGDVVDNTILTLATNITGEGGFNLDHISGTAKNGRVVLTGTNTYSGPTTLNNGNFQVGNGGTGSISSVTTVNAPATLSGTGSILKETHLSGILSPGDNGGTGIGMLTIADLALKDGSTILFKFVSADATIANLSQLDALNDPTQSGLNDFVQVTNVLSSDPNAVINLQLDFTGMSLVEGMVFDLIDAETFAFAENTTYHFTIIGATLDPLLTINTSRFDELGIIAITVVPEPGRMLLVLIALGIFSFRRRRSSK